MMSDVAHSPETQAQSEIGERRLPLLPLLDTALEAFRSGFEAELAAAGYDDVRPTHGCVFRFVEDGGMRLTVLSELAGITKQSAGEIIDDLVDRGYVERFPDPADRRAKLIRLTGKGRRAQEIGRGLLVELERKWGERYGTERIALLRELLEEIAAGEDPTAVPELAESAAAPR
jgi:DNA-binding MarR family transcriptional regulator